MTTTTGKSFVIRRGQTAIPNRTIYDRYESLATLDGPQKDGTPAEPRALSIQALGCLLLLLSRPDNAPSGYRALMGRGMGREALLKALRELNAAGHRFQFKRKGVSGTLLTDTVVSESALTEDEARAEWSAMVAKLDRDEEQAAKKGAAEYARLKAAQDDADAKEAVRIAGERLARELGQIPVAQESGATGSESVDNSPPPCAALPAHGQAAHNSLGGVPKSLLLRKETGIFHANEKAQTREPSLGGAVDRDDATPGPGRAAVRELLAERRENVLGINKGSRSAPANDKGAAPWLAR